MESLRSRIKRVFPRTPIPTAPIIDTYDDEGIIPAFLGRAWDSFTTQELRNHCAAISFLNTSAFLYYLPAFVVASIDDPEAADIIPDNLLSKFGNSDAGQLVARLTTEQRDVLVEFFGAYVGDDPCYMRPLAEALDYLKPGRNESAR